jgi:hypothetical protein
MAPIESRKARVHEVRKALRDSADHSGRVPIGDERVRIATVLLRFGRSVPDPGVMIDALLAAASQIATEHGVDLRAVQDDFSEFLTAAQQDVVERGGASPRDSAAPSEEAAPAGKLN